MKLGRLSSMGFVHGQFDKTKLINTYKGEFSKKYDIVKLIGEGAGGKAYVVKEIQTGAQYVAKEAHGSDASELLEELEWMSKLHHPNIARVFESVQGQHWDIEQESYRDEIFVITEFAAGLDLCKYMREALKHNARLTEEWVAGVFKKAMQGVAYLHTQGVIHNDLKLDNILMLEAFNKDDPCHVPPVVITDFGRAQQGTVALKLGDPRYQSPQKWMYCHEDFKIELSDEEKEEVGDTNDNSSDVWSMGMALFELLSGGKLAFVNSACALDDIIEVGDDGRQRPAQILVDLCKKVCGPDPPDLTACDGLSDDAADLMQLMLRKRARDRPSAASVLQHKWFSISGHRLSHDVIKQFQVTTMKGVAHAIFLEAMTTKLQREYYESVYAVFEEADSDKTGVLDKKEFTSTFEKMGKDPSKAALAFDQVDTDKSGFINFNEFMVATFDWSSVTASELQVKLREVFQQLDLNGDGEVDKHELEEYFKGVLTVGQIEETFKIIDTDKSGTVSLEELDNFLFKRMSDDELKKYTEAMGDAPVELCEVVQTESVVAASCFGLACFAGMTSSVGSAACFVGLVAGLLRMSKTKQGRDFLHKHTSKEE